MSYNLEDNIAFKILEKRGAHKFLADIQQIKSFITPILNEICIYFDNYTLHDINHSLRVLHYMCDIAGEESLEKLSDLELSMIIDVALLHDVGMWIDTNEKKTIENNSQFLFYINKNNGDKKLALQDYIRPIHGKRSFEYILHDKKISPLLYDSRLSTVSFGEDVALICQSHMESIDWINENLKENFSKGDQYNSKYIALLLRIADYIDFDSQRAPQYLLEHKHINAFSYNEWKKHADVCNYEKINAETKTIYFDINCSDFHMYCSLMDTLESMNKEVSNCVKFSKTFRDSKYHLPIKDSIDCNIYTKGFSPKRFSFALDYHKVTSLLMGENLYGDKKYGFRELLQNSLDACSVMKEYYLRTDPTSNYEPCIRIIYDYDKRIVMIKDNGTGMSKDIIEKYFLTIGKSYYRSDEYEKQGYKINPTGTFGIGFLSCFMLSDKVNICTKFYETGEISAFSLEKESKYICHVNSQFSEPHGTEISLSMKTFNQVFTKNTLLAFINENFYQLNVKVCLYETKNRETKFIDQANATTLTRSKNIDLSAYLSGAECKVSLSTLLDDIKNYDSFPKENYEEYEMVLFGKNKVSEVTLDSANEYLNKKCTIIHSVSMFEELLSEFYYNYFVQNNNDYDIEDIMEYFERYGFIAFSPDFDVYREDNEGWWIYERDYDTPICIFWDESIPEKIMSEILKTATIRFLIDSESMGRLSMNEDDYIFYSRPVVEGNTPDELELSSISDQVRNYNAKVCYRDVLLSDVQLKIPHVANFITEAKIVVNITRDDFIPSVTRRGLTPEQEQIVSYAVGKAIHMYLIEKYSDDKIIASAMKRLICKSYSESNILCK